MKKTFSQATRTAAINLRKKGLTFRKISEITGINRFTVAAWWYCFKKTGLISDGQFKSSKINYQEFAEFVRNNKNLEAKDIAKHFGISDVWARILSDRVTLRDLQKSANII